MRLRIIELKEDAVDRSKDGDKGDDKACFWERDPSVHREYGEMISGYQSRKRDG